MKLPRPTREQRRLAETLLPLLQEVEHALTQGRPAEALAVLQGAASEPPLLLSPSDQLRWHWLAGAALLASQHYKEAQDWLKRGLALAERLRPYVLVKQEQGFDALTERVRDLLGSYYFQAGQPGQALLVHRQCLLAISSGRLTDQAVQTLIYSSLGNDALALGQPEDAIGYFTLARQLAEARHDDRQHALAAWGLGRAYAAGQHYAHAQAAFQEALPLFEAQGDQHMSGELHAAVGRVLLRLKDYGKAEGHFRQCLEVAERSGKSVPRAAARDALAQWYLAAGEFDKAISTLQAGLDLLQESRDQQAKGRLMLSLARVYQGQHHAPAAAQAFKKALAEICQSEDSALLLQAHEAYAAFLSSQGRFQEAFAQEEAARALQAGHAGG